MMTGSERAVEHDHVLGGEAKRAVERKRGRIVRFGSNPDFLASLFPALAQHFLDHACGDSLPLVRWRDADVVDVQLIDGIGVIVNDRPDLPDHNVIAQRDAQDSFGIGEADGKPVGRDVIVEDIFRDIGKESGIVGAGNFDCDTHYRFGSGSDRKHVFEFSFARA